VGDKDAATEERAASVSEAQAGLKFQAGHPVVLIISDFRVARRKSDAPTSAGKVIQGSFHVGDHVMNAATFRLHKDSGDGPLVTPETLAGGSTELSWNGDHWVTGDDGKYRFTDLADGRYFVELFSREPPAEGES
jgi:hypothetical protein